MAADWTERFTGAYATPELVGREKFLAQFKTTLQDSASGPRAVFFIGDGGIGKTRLLKEFLKVADKMSGVCSADEIIDLYHVSNHTASGLADSFCEVLNRQRFGHYEQERRILDRMRLSGSAAEIAEQRGRTFEAFATDLKALAQKQRIVLALDTAERLVYGLNRMPKPISEVAEAWSWLMASLPRWDNIILLIAGRESADPLREQLNEILGRGLTHIPLQAFTEEESLAYFEAVIRWAETRGNSGQQVAKRIANLKPETRRLAYLYSQGRPIVLALLVDYISLAGLEQLQLPGALHGQVPEVEQAKILEKLEELKEQLITRLKETQLLGDTILALGRVPKGADKKLLAGLLGISPEEAEDRLSQIKDLSFVKIRPVDDRVFLHDEMYTILRGHVYDKPDDAAAAEKAGQAIRAYYDEQLDRCVKEMIDLYKPVEEEGKGNLDLHRLTEVHTRRQALLTEIVYYRLRQDAVKGFQRYYRYTREATLSGDTSLDLQLEVEMLAFVAERDPGGKSEKIDNLEISQVTSVMAVRLVARAWAERKYQKALEEVEILRRYGAAILAGGGSITEATWDAWEALVLTYKGGKPNWGTAQKKFDQAVQNMEGLLKGESTTSTLRIWRAQAILAFAYRGRGYLNRLRGFMEGAVEDYRRATARWREVNLQTELAGTLNDMGFAMSELGFWSDGRALVNDALDLRRQLGPRSPVGFSLTTLANIYKREGSYGPAIQRAEAALAIFRALEDQRGVGVALIELAEAERRHSGSRLVPDVEDKVRHLREARDHAKEALTIFEKTGETSRQVDALIEIGCACRDWVRRRRERPNPRDNIDRLIAESEKTLLDAAGLASEGILYRQVGAFVSLAWHGLYSGQKDLLEKYAEKAEAAIPQEYKIDKNTGRPSVPPDQAQILLWPQMGRLNVLYGHQVFDQFSKTGEDLGTSPIETPVIKKTLTEAVYFYTLGLEYGTLYSMDYPDLRRSKDQIYDRLKLLNTRQLRLVATRVLQVEDEYHLAASEMRHFLQHRALWYDR